MKPLLVFLSCVFTVLFLMHEFDAVYLGEWRMMKFLRHLQERTQYLVFLYVHIPFVAIFIYCLWSTHKLENLPFLVILNSFGLIHLIIHLTATKWQSNVFDSLSSFLFIWGIGITGAINLFLLGYLNL